MSSEPDAGDLKRCSPCRGTGQLISTLGGESKAVPCPWCEGTGHVIPEHDAQARWRPRGAEGGHVAAEAGPQAGSATDST